MTPEELMQIESYLLDRKKPDYELSKMIMEACEKQTPKKPTHEATLYKSNTCPYCKNVVDEFVTIAEIKQRVLNPYCKLCGQALDWSDAE